MAVILFVLVLLSLQPTSILIILILIRQTHLHRVFAYLISSTRQRPSYQLLLSPIYLPVDYPTSKFISCAYICVGTYTTIVGLALAWTRIHIQPVCWEYRSVPRCWTILVRGTMMELYTYVAVLNTTSPSSICLCHQWLIGVHCRRDECCVHARLIHTLDVCWMLRPCTIFLFIQMLRHMAKYESGGRREDPHVMHDWCLWSFISNINC